MSAKATSAASRTATRRHLPSTHIPSALFEGTVTQVRQSPQTVQNVVTYDVVVSVDNSDLALKPGLTAATRIIVDQRSDVLRVPNQALRYVPTGTALGDTKQARVWVLRDGTPTPVQVTVGLDDDEFTEIVQGDLKVDDRVIVAEQRNSANGAFRRAATATLIGNSQAAIDDTWRSRSSGLKRCRGHIMSAISMFTRFGTSA